MNEYFVKIYCVPDIYRALCWAGRECKFGSVTHSGLIEKVAVIHIRDNPKAYTNINI